MNHPLAVYTVIYVAILFVTVSIWGGKIGEAGGDHRVLLLALGAFGLKLAIDDYIHFQGASKSLVLDLALSLVIYLLLAASIACAASGRGQSAALLFAGVFAVGAGWIVNTGFGGEGGARRKAWLAINVVAAVLLLLTAWRDPPHPARYTMASLWLGLLVLLIVVDFVVFGTLQRLAKLSDAAGRAAAGVAPAVAEAGRMAVPERVAAAGGEARPERADAADLARRAEGAGSPKVVDPAPAPAPVVAAKPATGES
jgi:hypothetical protein